MKETKNYNQQCSLTLQKQTTVYSNTNTLKMLQVVFIGKKLMSWLKKKIGHNL